VKKRIWLSLAIALTLVLVAGLATYAGGNKCCKGGKGQCPLATKDCKVEVTNIDKGITVKITSDDPGAVKQIEEHAANCKCEKVKDAKFEVTKLDNGVTLNITSDNPESVKLIQEQQANCMKNCQKECKGGGKGGKCSGQMSGCKHQTK
jgi:TusA-related sulfurtransferase